MSVGPTQEPIKCCRQFRSVVFLLLLFFFNLFAHCSPAVPLVATGTIIMLTTSVQNMTLSPACRAQKLLTNCCSITKHTLIRYFLCHTATSFLCCLHLTSRIAEAEKDFGPIYHLSEIVCMKVRTLDIETLVVKKLRYDAPHCTTKTLVPTFTD